MSTKNEKTTALKVIPENIPDELKKLKQWTLWKYHKKEDGTFDKPNYQPNGAYAVVDNPDTWSTFETVLTAYQKDDSFDGIGFVVTKESGIVGMDLDNVAESPQKEKIFKEVEAFQSYTEKSPSGNGIRIFVRGIQEGPNRHVGNFETYDGSKFLSVTGHVISAQKTITRAPGALVRFYRNHFPEIKPVVLANWKPSSDMTDEEILNHLKKATNNEKFFVLYSAGDWGKYYSSHSEGDAALCSLIAFYTQDWDQIDRIFRTSALYRADKWGDREDYREKTQNWVFSHLTETYQPLEPKKNTKKENSNLSKSKDTKLYDEDGNLIIPEHIKSLLNEAEEGENKGFVPCLKWIEEHAIELAAIDKVFWQEQNIGDKKNPVMIPPDLVFNISIAFKLDDGEHNDIYPILKKNNLLYHNTAKKFHKIRVALALYPEEVKQCAIKELTEGDPYNYIVETWQTTHTGDEGTGKTLPLCAISTMILGENKGLHFKQSGESGKGKTSGIDSFLSLLPPSMVIRGSISDKYVYYSPEEDITDGSLIFIDDRELSESLKGVVKTSVSNYQNPEAHRTVIDGKGCVYTPAKRLTWLFASVDGFDDEQLSNRFLMADVDNSPEQDEKVAENQRKAESSIFFDSNFRVEVCQCMFDILRTQNYKTRIPYLEALKWHNPENRRNQPKFFDIIRAVSVFRLFQRDIIKGYVVATKEDLERAEEIYDYTAKQTKSNLTAQEQQILNLLCKWNEDPDTNDDAKEFKENPSHRTAYRAPIKDIAAALDLPVEKLRKIMEGRPQKGIQGLTDRIRGLFKDFEDSGHHAVLYSYSKRKDTFSDLNVFVTYKDADIERETINFVKKLINHPIPISTETTIERHAFLNISPLSPLLTTQGGEKFFKRVGDIFNIIKDYTKISNNRYKISHHNLGKCMLEKEILECEELESEQFNFLQYKQENTQKICGISGKSGEILKKEANDSENISPLGVERCGESGEILDEMPFVAFTDAENMLHTKKVKNDENPFVLEIRYSQKPDITITPENQQLHEENLHQLSLIPNPTKLDHFYLHVEGIDIQKIPAEEEEKRIAGFESDCLELEKVGKLNPLNRANEMQELFNIWNHAMHAYRSYEGKLTLNEILDRRFKDLQDRWLGCFFIERAVERGEVQVCNA